MMMISTLLAIIIIIIIISSSSTPLALLGKVLLHCDGLSSSSLSQHPSQPHSRYRGSHIGSYWAALYFYKCNEENQIKGKEKT